MLRDRAVGFAAVGLLAAATPSPAQDSAFVLVDRIAAVVGTTVIPLTRVHEELNVMRQQGAELPQDSAGLAALRRTILDRIIDQELMVQAALRDTTITVTEQEIQSAVDRAFREIRDQFASDLEFRRQLELAGFGTSEEYRRWLTEQQRRELLQTQLIQKLRAQGTIVPLAPTEAELRAFYEETRARQPKRPATVTFRQIVVRAEADSTAQAAARQLADSLVRELRGGADFAVVARRFSDDPGSRDQGGELGWTRRGNLVPEFEQVAFSIRPGAISPPVKSVFGYHIIQVQRSQPAEVQVRHILIAPDITQADRARARARAQPVVAGLQAGVRFDSLAALYHDRAGQEQTIVENFPRADLPPAYRAVLDAASPGDVLGPVLLDLGDGRPKYAAIRFEEARPEGLFSFDDLRDQLRNMLAEQNAMQRYLESLRSSTYIEIRL